MKHLLRSLPLLLLTTTTLFFVSCSKDGDPGKDGAQGPAGSKGDKGDKGDPGAVGTANVIYSTWLDVAYKPDTVHLAGGKIDTIGWYSGIEVPKLSKALLANGEVKVYINLNESTDPVITPIPYVDLSGINISYIAYEKTIEFYSNINASTYLDAGSNKKYQQYRYILIPGGTTARTATGNVDWNDYKSVQAFLGLKD